MQFTIVSFCPNCQTTHISNSQLRIEPGAATWRGRFVLLTMTEHRVIELLQSKTRFFSYREIYDVVQSPGFLAGSGIEGYRSNVRSVIKRLRRRIEAVDPSFNAIECMHGYGYAWREEPPVDLLPDPPVRAPSDGAAVSIIPITTTTEPLNG